MNNNYLPLTEYSLKHKVSISTLRRKIKAEDITYIFEDGKYLILDGPAAASPAHPSPKASGAIVSEIAPLFGITARLQSTPGTITQALAELTGAYTKILQEKERKILQLNQELTDLKTWAGVLEDENEKLKYNKK